MLMINNLDMLILNFINDNLHNPTMDKLMVFITKLGNGGLVWILISIILIAIPKYRKVGVMAICALILTTILGEVILKNILQRERPFTTVLDFELLIKAPSSYSFPSGHTGSSFAVTGILGSKFKKSRIYIYFVAMIIAFSRLYLYVHYPSDVLAGVILGSASASIILYVFCDKWKKKNIEKVDDKLINKNYNESE